MASGGRAKLSQTILQAIQDANVRDEEDQLEGIYKRLLGATQRDVCADTSEKYGVLKDWPKKRTPSVVVNSDCKMENKDVTACRIDEEELTLKLLEHVQSGSGNINVIIELVSKLDESVMDAVSLKCWSFLTAEEHKKSFIIAMSSTRNSTISVCSKILFPLFEDEKSFQSALNCYGPILGWLDCNITSSLIIPLMLNENSPIIKDIVWCKGFFTVLTDTQRSNIIITYSNAIRESLQEWHLQPLSVILEMSSFDKSVLPSLITMLTANISRYSNNRLLGKLLLTVISSLPSCTHNEFCELSNLVSLFKGPLRFSHKRALNKVAKQIQPNC